jgi:hypothetical protein
LPRRTEAWLKQLAAGPSSEPGPERDTAAGPSSPAPAKKEAARPAAGLVILAGGAAVIVAGVALWRNGAHVAHNVPSSSAPANAAAPSPATGRTKETETSGGGAAFDSIKFQGLIYSSRDPAALINGKVLRVGERINGVEIISIETTGVVLASKGQLKRFKLK